MTNRYKVKGFKNNCPNFNPCPVCYKCRNYDPSYYKCATQCSNEHCNTSKHTDQKVGFLIKPQTITI